MNCLVGVLAGLHSINFFAGNKCASRLEGLLVIFIVELQDIWGSLCNTSVGPFTFLKSVLLRLVLGALLASAQFNLQGVVVVNHPGLPSKDGDSVSALRWVL